LPLTIEVAKSFRIRIAASSKRLGPSFSRPGSILLPHDRLLYQALADQAAPIVADKTDPARFDIYERSSIELIGRGVGIFATHLELLEALDKCGAGTVDIGVIVYNRSSPVTGGCGARVSL
jgi:hypothetical protein